MQSNNSSVTSNHLFDYEEQQPINYEYEDIEAEEGIRRADQQRVDRLIPDENEIIDEEAQQQMFLMEQQLLYQ